MVELEFTIYFSEIDEIDANEKRSLWILGGNLRSSIENINLAFPRGLSEEVVTESPSVLS